jgi:hypothetical protein
MKYLSVFIYVSDLQEEESMEKKYKRKKVEEEIHLIYTTSCREVKERDIVKKYIRRVNIGREAPKKILDRGSIPREIVTLFSQDIKGGVRERYIEKEHKHVKRKNKDMNIEGSAQREIPFSIDVKGEDIETLMSSDGNRRRMRMVFLCLSVSIDVGVFINAKGRYCWTIGCH